MEQKIIHLLSHLLKELPAAQVRGNPTQPISGIAYDSRKIQPGDLFVAIRGTHTDGHRYIASALERGASALAVDERYWDASSAAQIDVPIVVLPNSLVALSPLAAAFYNYPARELKVVGITGTKGKTTTTSLTSRVLDSVYSSGMIGTLDFKIGPRQWANKTRQSTPEALEIQQMLREMVQAKCDYAVLEATSHALSASWNRLGDCDFDLAVFTNVTHEHLDYHGSVEQYRRDKARLFEALGQSSNNEPWAIVNADDPYHQLFLDAAPSYARRFSFGIDAQADLRAEEIVATASGTRALLRSPWGHAPISLRLPGLFNLVNSLAAISVGLSQNIPLETCIAALEAVEGVRGRMQPVNLGQPFAVIVDYAHNPDSFEQVMSMLRPLTKGRIIALFGSAGERDRAKRPMQGAIAARYCDYLVLSDEDPRAEDRYTILEEIAAGAEQEGKRLGSGYACIADRREALQHALAYAQPDDLVLLLGKGHESTIQYDGFNLEWDEAAEAEKALRELGYGQ
jgi:UDP-N-acetylmuramoyl-L-alanyl-D-glutamate--2,6-diaminopimelate ligase